jgi:hypothetical protein
MKLSCFPVLSLAALLAAGCSSTPTRVDTGPIRATTFEFMQRAPQSVSAAFADRMAPIHPVIQDAITRDLSAKGLSKVASGSDVTVAYLVIIGSNVSTKSVNDYFGYGRDAMALQDKAQDAYTGKKVGYYFEAGTLLIDILDSKTFKLLRRNYVTRSILRNPSAEARAANIQEAVDEALQGLRIAR